MGIHMERLAVLGGTPVRETPIFYGRQCIEDDDIEAVVRTLKSDLITCGPRVEELERKLDEWGIGLFLSGHLHVQHYKTSKRYPIDEIVTSALAVSPCQYGVLQFFGPENYYYFTEILLEGLLWDRL